MHMEAKGSTYGAGMDDSCPHLKDKDRHPGVGLLNTLWKLVEDIIDTCIQACIIFYEVFHGLRAGRGTWKAILEIKLAQ